MAARKRSHRHGGGALLAIAVFKFIKGAVLLALAFGALSFLHKDLASHVELWLDQLRIDADNMPLEVYELVKEFTAVRLLALLANAAVVLYLIYFVRQKENGAARERATYKVK
jgi:uncharacterized membrane protein (DUF2068 family)